MHALCAGSCFYREIFEANVGSFGCAMRFVEVVLTLFYIALMVRLLNFVIIYLGFHPKVVDDAYSHSMFKTREDHDLPDCLLDKEKRDLWAGTALQWFLIEIVIFLNYLATMIFLLMKSRITVVGMDQSGQFEPFYQSLMANRIIQGINFNRFSLESIDESKEKMKDYFVGKIREVESDGVKFKVQLTEEDCMKFYEKWYYQDDDFVSKDEAKEWMTSRLLGSITKQQLDD